MNKIITIFFVLGLFLIQINLISAIPNTGSIDVNVKFMPSLDVKLSGPHVIRTGDITFIKVKIFNDNSDEGIILNSIKIFDEKNKVVISEEPYFNFNGVKKQDTDRLEQIQLETMYIADKDITKVDVSLLNEMQDLKEQIKNKIFVERFSLDVNQFDSNLDGEINFLFSFEFIKNGKKEIVTQTFIVSRKPQLPSVATRNSPGWYAGDQHVHSEYSCFGIPDHSDATIEENADAAKVVGLDWMIITDHGPMIPTCGGWSNLKTECDNEDSSSFKCLRGEEIGFCDHLLAYGSPDLSNRVTSSITESVAGTQDEIDDVTSQGGIAFIAHPHHSGSAFFCVIDGSFDWDNWENTGWTGLEILNGAWNSNSNDGTTISNPGGENDSWGEFLNSETNPNDGFIVGIGGSDTHDSDFGNPWGYTYCYMDSLSDSNIVSALENGNCVASTGPLVTFTLDGNIIGSVVDVMSGTNTLDIFANSSGFGDISYIIIYLDGEYHDEISVFDDTYSGSFDIELDTDNEYIRLSVYTTEIGRAYTNPIWVDVTSCSCGSWSVGSCGAGSCGSEQKQWTRSCSPSACATETQCVYDEACEDEEEGEGSGSSCTESGYDQCYEYTYGDCDVKLAVNWYDNVPNTILWGAVNDAWDPYVVGEYKIGWKGVDSEQMYYDIDDPNNDCKDGEGDCQGGCDGGEEIVNTGTKATVTAPGTASTQRVLAYDDTASSCCWAYFNPFSPSYGNNPSIYVLNCFNDSDCSGGQYCDKSSNWSNWDCVTDKSNGQSCARDAQCSSGYCDNDGVGLGDDGWCFTPYNTYFDGQETSYCEYSTGSGHINCDERQVGDDLNLCLGTSYYEDECSSTCTYQDITSVFECSDAGCSCSEPLCDGLTTGNNITTCSSGQTYFADKCTSTAGGQNRGDNICRNSTFASGCTADAECNGVVAGTGNCSATCTDITDPPIINILYPENISYDIDVVDLNYTITGGYEVCWWSNDSGITNYTSAMDSMEGSNTWTIWCNNSFGNEGTNNVTFFQDTGVNNVPTHSTPILNSSSGYNGTSENLTCYNQSTSDVDNDDVKNIFNWIKNSSSIAVLNMPFEAGSNSTFTKDYSGEGNHGEVINAIWNSSAGYDGFGAYEFDGLGQDTISTFITPVNGTISMWAYFDNVSVGTKYFYNSGSSNWNILRLGYTDAGNPYFGFYDEGNHDILNTSMNYTPNKWYYVVAKWGSEGMKLYVDDQLSGTNAYTGNGDGDQPMFIGCKTIQANVLNGSIDEVVVYDYSLSAEQITALYNNRTDLIVSQETSIGDNWTCEITPNDGIEDGTTLISNELLVL